MGFLGAFIGTFLGTAALTCIAHPCSAIYGVHWLVNKYLSDVALLPVVLSVEMARDVRWGRACPEVFVRVGPIWLGW